MKTNFGNHLYHSIQKEIILHINTNNSANHTVARADAMDKLPWQQDGCKMLLSDGDQSESVS